ncbi:hypothetical protein FOWG_03626 [Fusarium oxysporum f. sp. lycopersici MN25]|uniref:Uncharacterized protein n=1 Tax=Fusarium oxysporum Fo47 TaxID=660027 RepID=W9K342_FUSOX|nr:hypothetical protein FOZG_11658 [Fusarium oxysporum Fo47]EWZ96160.1 hypothetical protein FOWG_03626 [Fusarium oxysporum f. sp. lycopersici MN25]
MKYHQSRQLYLIEVLPDHSSVNMPTATEYFGISVTNIGPLTTTYTPPPACTRATTDHLVYALESSLIYGFGSPDCEIDPYGKCLPSGAAVDSFIKEYSHPKSGQGIHPFHSPGIHCPEGWTTAGLLAHGDKTGSAFRSGVFTTTATVNSSQPLQMGSDEWWLKVLEPSETLAWCCPSGWDSLPYGYCRSSIAPALSAGYNSACYEGFPESAFVTVHTVEGERVSDTDGLISLLPSITYTTETVALTEQWSDPSLVASMVIARQFPAIEMIYKSEDVKAAKNGSKDDADDDKDGKAKDNDNAASTLSKVGGVVSGVALMVGLLTGAGLLMPW